MHKFWTITMFWVLVIFAVAVFSVDIYRVVVLKQHVYTKPMSN